MQGIVTWIAGEGHWLAGYLSNQFFGTLLAPGSSLSVFSLVLTLLLAAFLAVPRGRARMPRWRVWRRALFPRRMVDTASGRADVAWFVFSLFGYGLLFGWALVSSTQIAHGVSAAVGPLPLIGLPALVAKAMLTLLLFVAFEFAYWLDHYLSHSIPLLWQFHRVHHSAESLSLLTIFRVHPVDTIVYTNILAVVLGVTQGVAAPALGVPHGWTIGELNVLVMVSAIGLNHLQHSHLWITFGPRWGRWLLSPAHHQIHHSRDAVHHNRNFGSTLALFDRLFGTLHLPAARREPLSFGLGDEVRNPHGLRAVLVDPLVDAVALLPALPRRDRARPLAQPLPPSAEARDV